MVKPLKDLLQQADRFLGNTKVASAGASDEVSSLANTLQFATEIEKSLNLDGNNEADDAARAMNKIAAQAELEVLIQCDQFEKAALADGYTKEQVDEALQKIAAKKMHKNLGLLASVGGLAPGEKDLNSQHPVKVKEIGEEKRRLPAAHSLGGSR